MTFRDPKTRRPQSACEVCGYRIHPVGWMMSWLLSMAAGEINHRSPRWPQRRNMAMYCPECRHLNVLANEVSARGVGVVEFL